MNELKNNFFIRFLVWSQMGNESKQKLSKLLEESDDMFMMRQLLFSIVFNLHKQILIKQELV